MWPYWQQQQGVDPTTIEQTYRDAATRHPDGLLELARWKHEQGMDPTSIEQAYRDAAAAGAPDALQYLKTWLGEQGRQADADQLRQHGFEHGPDW